MLPHLVSEHRGSSVEYACRPEAVVVIGASATESKWGHLVLKGIIQGGYRGKIYPVNPKATEILGLRAYANVLDIEEPIDLAVIGIKATLVPQAIEDCKNKGVKVAIIISGGFAEVGEEGRKLQEEVIKMAGDVRIIGPNTLGIVNLSHNFNASFLRPLRGSFALLCQGGNVIAEVEYIARRKGLGFTQIIDPGNQADVGICDFLEYINDDPETKAILMYIEGFGKNEGRRFLRIAKEITKTKPIIAIKVGVTEAGAKAIRSHTGSLAGDDAIYDAAFRQAGIIRVRNSYELVDTADALLRLPVMKSNKFGILVDGGSHSTMACDAASKYGLELSDLSDKTQRMLRKILLPHSPVSNPVDFAGAMDADVRVLTKASDLILQDENVDGLLLAGINFGGYSQWWGAMEKEIAYGLTEVQGRYTKPMILHNSVLSQETPALQIINDGGIPVYSDVERAARCMAALADYGMYIESVKKGVELPVPVSEKLTANNVAQIIRRARAGRRHNLLETEARQILKEYGLPVPEFRVATTKEDAGRVAEKIGYPVAAKVLSAKIIHKTEAGGVKLNLKDKDEVEKAFDEIIENARRYSRDTQVEGVIISPMERVGTEVIIGMIRDAQFGPVIMFGLGGIFVEVLKDVSFRVVPLEEHDAWEMVREIQGYPVLKGVRGKAKDINAIVNIILKISKLSMENEKITELDLNPVVVFEEGASVVDTRMIIGNQ